MSALTVIYVHSVKTQAIYLYPRQIRSVTISQNVRSTVGNISPYADCIAFNLLLSLPHLKEATLSKVRCMVHWSPSVSVYCLHQLLPMKFQGDHVGSRKKAPSGRRFSLSIFVLQSSFKFWTCMIFLHIFWRLHSNDVKVTNNFYMLVLGSSLDGRKSTKGKAKIANPKANRVCPPINSEPHFSWACAKLMRTPILPYGDGAPSYSDVQRYASSPRNGYLKGWYGGSLGSHISSN